MSFIPEKDSKGNIITRLAPFCVTEYFHFRGTGISGTATAGTTTNIDYQMPEERYINGIRLVLNGQVFGDSVNFEVVDVDNIIGLGAGVVLDQFGKDWYVNPDMACQGDIIIDYPAKVVQGLYIRMAYQSTGSNDVGVKANLYLHKKMA